MVESVHDQQEHPGCGRVSTEEGEEAKGFRDGERGIKEDAEEKEQDR